MEREGHRVPLPDDQSAKSLIKDANRGTTLPERWCLMMKQRHPRGSRSWWAIGLWANSELTVAWFDSIGLPRLWKGDLNNTNRRMRTRKSGGVGGD